MQKLMKLTALVCSVFIAVSMCVIIYMGYNRVVVIAQTGPDKSQDYSQNEVKGSPIALKQSHMGGAVLRIPLPEGTTAEGITIENLYSEQKLVITLQKAADSIYENEYIEGYISVVETAMLLEEEEKLTFHIKLTEAYEYESFLENGELNVHLYKPSDKYDRIVVLDEVDEESLSEPAHELLHEITEMVQLKLEENGICVYHLDDLGKKLKDTEKLELIQQLEANMYLGMGLYVSESSPESFGTITVCDTSYFRPYISNGMMADILQKEVVTAIQGKAAGIEVNEDNAVLKALEIPASVLYPGHASHAQEYSYMEQPSYQEKIATGALNGILKAYEMMEVQEEEN